MTQPTFDKDGYPTEETRKAIAEWPREDFDGLMKFVHDAWTYPEYFRYGEIENRSKEKLMRYDISTAGWSGNEEIVGAMKENVMFWTLCWVQSRRGGHYIFEVKK